VEADVRSRFRKMCGSTNSAMLAAMEERMPTRSVGGFTVQQCMMFVVAEKR
jgi:hypothetical protein